MLSVPAGVRLFVCTEPTDMRKGFDGLAGLVREQFELDPLSGSVFIFIGRRRDRVKLLYWDRDGLALWYKRLEKGTFALPTVSDGSDCASDGSSARVELTRGQVAMLLEGLDLSRVRRRPRYQPPGAQATQENLAPGATARWPRA